jgi:hypothetical protein
MTRVRPSFNSSRDKRFAKLRSACTTSSLTGVMEAFRALGGSHTRRAKEAKMSGLRAIRSMQYQCCVNNFHLSLLRPEPFGWIPQSLLGSWRGRRRCDISYLHAYACRPQFAHLPQYSFRASDSVSLSTGIPNFRPSLSDLTVPRLFPIT